MQNLLQQIQRDCVAYRKVVDQLFVPARRKRGLWRGRFLQILLHSSQLYLDLVYFLRIEAGLYNRLSKKKVNEPLRRLDVKRELDLRAKLKTRLDSPAIWIWFEPDNPFSEMSGLRSLEHYKRSFALHLPGIYAETFRVENCANDFMKSRSSSSLTELAVGLDHLARHHIGFVLHALEGVTDESSWSF